MNSKSVAHLAVSQALMAGDLAPATTCEACGTEKGARTASSRCTHVVYHHHDYSRPLDVIPLCRSCHTLIHNGKRPEPRTGRVYPPSKKTRPRRRRS